MNFNENTNYTGHMLPLLVSNRPNGVSHDWGKTFRKY